jgi:hypothetical protein
VGDAGPHWRDGIAPGPRQHGARPGRASPSDEVLVAHHPYSREGESEAQRLDRNYNEILQELRVAEAGVQILFAFLLGLAFTQRFGRVTPFERDVYFASLLLSAVAGGLLMAPAAMHRIMFRRGLKDVLVNMASVMALAGLSTLGLAVSGSVLLISDFLFGHTLAWITTAAVTAWWVALWHALPLVLRTRAPGVDSGQPAPAPVPSASSSSVR